MRAKPFPRRQHKNAGGKTLPIAPPFSNEVLQQHYAFAPIFRRIALKVTRFFADISDMKALRHFLTTGMVLLVALGAAFAADTQVRLASLTYSGTGGYTLVERSNLRRSINGRYVGLTTREVRSFISPSPSPRADYDRSTNPLSRGRWYNGSFYVMEETKHNAQEASSGVHDSIPSVFNISPEGKLTMYQDNGYPSFRSFPAFTTDRISVGDTWKATAERAVDPLNKGVFTRLRMEVGYTFLGEDSYRNQPVYHIKAMWQTSYGMMSYRDLHGDDTLVKALGGHKADIYVNRTTGATVMIIDNVDETFVYNDGTSVNLKGTINLFTEFPPAIDTEKLIPALQRIASVTPEVAGENSTSADTGSAVASTKDGGSDRGADGTAGAGAGTGQPDGADNAIASTKGGGSGNDSDGTAGADDGTGQPNGADNAIASAKGSGSGNDSDGTAGADDSFGQPNGAGDAIASAKSGNSDNGADSTTGADAGTGQPDGAGNAVASAKGGGSGNDSDGMAGADDGTGQPNGAGNAVASAKGAASGNDSDGTSGADDGTGRPNGGGNAIASAKGSGSDNGADGDAASAGDALRQKSSAQANEAPKNNIVVEKTNAGIRLSVRDVKFKADSAEMLPGESRRLDEIARVLKLAENTQFLVEGHTAAVGKPNGEQTLSEQRARRIAQELEKRGVNTQAFICRGWGGTKPIADNGTANGRAQNRRVEITILQ